MFTGSLETACCCVILFVCFLGFFLLAAVYCIFYEKCLKTLRATLEMLVVIVQLA